MNSDAIKELIEKNRIETEWRILERLSNRYLNFIGSLIVDGKVNELRNYFPKEDADLTLDAVKLWLLLLKRSNSAAIPQVLSFMGPIEYGWNKDKYYYYNPCLRERGSSLCKRTLFIHEAKEAEASFGAIREIFFDKEHGNITMLIFNYCLASLFSSHLNLSNIPCYLQIACDKNTVLYDLIQEIVAICDVNVGILEECKKHGLWSCGYDPKTIYPHYDIEKNIIMLDSIKDIPVIVDGHGSLRNYHALLRELANKPNKRSIAKNGNVLPIFMCPSIKMGFRNVFSMDLTGEMVSEDYLSLVKENRKTLASLVLGLVRNPIECLFPEDGTDEDRQAKYVDGEYPFSKEITKRAAAIRRAYKTTQQTAKNVGVLSFFFMGILRVLARAINANKFPTDKEFTYKNELRMKTATQHLTSLYEESYQSMVETHIRFSPVPIDSIAVDIDGVAANEKARAEKKARRYAIDIVRCYQSFETSISIRKINIKGERYIFYVDVPEGTRQYRIFKEAGDVQAAMKLEYFKPVRDGLSIIIVASEKLFKENSLLKIMESPLFKQSKLKIPFAMGYDIMGEMVVEDLAEFTHTLVGGSTGSGKSTALHTLLLSIVSKQPADDVKLLIFDFGITYLSQFRKAPHLLHPIITDMDVGVDVIMMLKDEHERRRAIYHKNPDDRSEFNKLPPIFCIIDEFHKFIRHGTTRKERAFLQEMITGLLAEARGTKIHLILAAQDPTEEKMKCGVTNLGTCLAFRCTREHNSRVMIQESGAENLLGKGDMLFKRENGHPGLKSIQGAYIDEKDLVRILEEMSFSGASKYEFLVNHRQPQTESGDTSPGDAEVSKANPDDEKLPDVIMWALKQNKIANSRMLVAFQIGDPRGKKFLGLMAEWRLIEKLHVNLGWRVIPKRIEDISAEVLEFLARHGYSDDDIANALGQRPGNDIPQNDSDESGVQAEPEHNKMT